MSVNTEDPFNLARFVDAQALTYESALSELRASRKESHWIWFVLPQLRGLGSSPNAEFYGIRSAAEAKAYLRHPVLGPRLEECVRTLNALQGVSADAVLGSLDAKKYRSCLTLFAAVADDPSLFQEGLRRYFASAPDIQTVNLLSGQGESSEG